MSARRLQLGILFLAIFVDMVGFGIVIPILPLYAVRFEATPVQIGWLVGIFSLAQFLFSPLWGHWSDKMGRKPILIISTLGTAIGFLILGAANTLFALFVGRLIDGISGGKIGTAQACVADTTAPEGRSRAMGLIGAAIGLGFVFGPALGGWLSSRYGHAVPMYAAGGLALVNAAIILFAFPETLPKAARHLHKPEPLFPNLFSHMRAFTFFGVVLSHFCITTGFSIMTTLFALFLWQRYQLDVSQTGYLLALIGVVGVVIQGGLIGRLLRWTSERRLAITGMLFLMVTLFLLPLAPGLAALVIVCIGVAIGNSLVTPTLMGIASRQVEPLWQGRAMGVVQSIGSLARWAGPALAGWMLVFDLPRGVEFYARTPFWGAAVFCLLALVIFGFGLRHQMTPPPPVPPVNPSGQPAGKEVTV
ncbi:MAG TPA: MFS transporter [Chthoniobacteraceae bacterium]|nr:MFS transporter [Chthoniobacteraceae bacterium]